MRAGLCKYQLWRVSPDGRHSIVYHRDEKKSYRYTFGEITTYVACNPASEWANWKDTFFGAETTDEIRLHLAKWA